MDNGFTEQTTQICHGIVSAVIATNTYRSVMFEIIHSLKKISRFQIHSPQASSRVLKKRLLGGGCREKQ